MLKRQPTISAIRICRNKSGSCWASAIREVEFGSVTISWRGVCAPASMSLLTREDVTKVKMKELTTKMLLGYYLNFVHFNAAYRAGFPRSG